MPKLLAREREVYQKFLNNHNAMNTVLTLLSEPPKSISNYETLYPHLITLGIALMEGGNREVQMSVYSYCVNHTQSELLFMQMKSIFEQEIEFVKKEEERDCANYLITVAAALETFLTGY